MTSRILGVAALIVALTCQAQAAERVPVQFTPPVRPAPPVLAATAASISVPFLVAYPPNSPVSRGAERFRDEVAKQTGGQVKIEIFPGTGSAIEAVRSGAAALAALPSTNFANAKVKNVTLFELPFFFDNLAEVAAVERGVVGDVILSSLADQGLVGLGYWNSGMSQLFARGAAIQTIADLKGRKIRTAVSDAAVPSVGALGAQAVRIPPAELWTALTAGAIDAGETSATLVNQFVGSSDGTVAVTEANFRPFVAVLVANERQWDSLPFRFRAAIADQVRAIASSVVGDALEQDRSALTALRNKGFRVLEVKRASFQEAAQSSWKAAYNIDADVLNVALTTVQQQRSKAPPRSPDRVERPPQGPPQSILFATNRVEEPSESFLYRLGARRGPTRYGWTVIAKTQVAGPEPEIMLRATNINLLGAQADFINEVSARLRGTAKDMLVYVHGYTTTLVSASEHLARLHTFTKFDGVPVLFSWPTDGSVLRYPHDFQQVIDSRNAFIEFLNLLRSIPEVRNIHLLTHSMGGRLATESLELMDKTAGQRKPLLYQLILAAPDVPIDRFTEVTPHFARMAKRITLYGSEKDHALKCSRSINRTARAGQGGDDVLVIKGVDTIDATNASGPAVESGWLLPCYTGHSYVMDEDKVRGDLHALMANDFPPARRLYLQPRNKTQIDYWAF